MIATGKTRSRSASETWLTSYAAGTVAGDAVGGGAGGAGHGGDGRPDGRHLAERGVRAWVTGDQPGVEQDRPPVGADELAFRAVRRPRGGRDMVPCVAAPVVSRPGRRARHAASSAGRE